MDVFELQASLKLDSEDYDRGLNQAKGQASSFGDVLKGTLASTAITKGLSLITSGIQSVGNAFTNITKQSVGAFANYEQLVGGVETLFSSLDGSVSSASKVMENANNAFKTSGMSANAYMETVTSFSAALVASLDKDYDKAAEVGDMAVQDMSDNANKMGTSIDMIQNAYQGFAKQNYMMLDNLKLGYGGTKTEMERLLADASKMSGMEYDINNLADVYNAIHVIQQEMGITGTTSEEAMHTIQGAANATKAAWENVLTAMAGGGDLGEAMAGLQSSLFGDGTDGSGLVKQLIPRIETAFEGIGQFVAQAAPIIAQEIPGMLDSLSPAIIALIQSLGTIIQTSIPILVPIIADAVPIIAQALMDSAPVLGQSILDLISDMASGLPDAMTGLTSMIMEGLSSLGDVLPILTKVGTQLLVGLSEGFMQALPVFIEKLPELVESILTGLTESLPILLAGMVTIAQGLTEALPEIITALTDALPQIIDTVVQTLITCAPQLIAGLVAMNTALVSALPEIVTALLDAIPQIIMSVVEVLVANAPMLMDGIMTIVTSLLEFITTVGGTFLEMIGTAMSNIITTIITFLQQLPVQAAFFAGEMVGQFINFLMTLPENIATTFQTVLDNIVSFGETFITEGPRIAREFGEKLISKLKEIPSKVVEIGKDIIEGLKQGIKDAWDGLTGWFGDIVGGFVEGVKSQLEIGSPSKVFANEVGQWIPAGIAMGIRGNITDAQMAMDELTTAIMPTRSPFEMGIDSITRSINANSDQSVNVNVTLEGDADRLFRVVQNKANANYRLTGMGMVTV